MRRLIITTALALATATAAHAQFTEGTKYIATSLSGLNMSYSKSSEFNFGLNAEGGYYFADAWMARANMGYNHAKTLDGFTLGAGVRYSFLQNGIFIGGGLEYAFDKYTNTGYTERVNNLRIPIEIGYTFYLNHYLAVEPAIYSKMSLNHFSEGSEFGLKIGLGFYFDRFHTVHRGKTFLYTPQDF